MKPVFSKVGIFGIGLLGGSVALGLRERFLAEEVHAYDADPSALEDALALGVVDRTHDRLGDWIGQLDLGILAAPVGALAALGQQVAPLARPDSLWSDVGSVKGPIVKALEPLLPNFVGSHPMAGSEKAGVEAAHAGLLENAVWVITPTPSTRPPALERLRELVEERALVHEVIDEPRLRRIREDMQRAEARRLQPHYIESFFLEAFRRLGGSVRPRE
ncbi:MAG: hypothetical protein C4327_04445, partial [Meiothermus sp.]